MRRLLLPLFAALLLAAPAARATPLVVTHHGRLLNAQDLPVNGATALTFKLWQAPTRESTNGATPLWTSSITADVTNGFYAVTLGKTEQGGDEFPEHVFEGERWLSVTIGDTELLPRLRLGTTPRADFADRAATAAHAALADHATLADGATLADKAKVANDLDCAGCVSDAEISGLDGTKIKQGTLPVSALTGTIPAALIDTLPASKIQRAGLDAETVDGLAASATPAAGKLFPLDQSAKVPLALLRTGSGSGLDADLLDGKTASDFVYTAGAGLKLAGNEFQVAFDGANAVARADHTHDAQYLPIDGNIKNLLFNGAPDFFQRGAAAVNLATTLSYASADRFRLAHAGFTGAQAERSTDVPANGRSRYSLNLKGTPGGSTSQLLVQQRIESAHARELAGGAASLSFWVKSESATQATVEFAVANGFDDFTTTTTAATRQVTVTTGSWQLVKVENVTIPAEAGRGLAVTVTLTNMTSTGALKNHTLGQFMLAPGARAAAFTMAGRNIQEEELLCLRYFETGASWAGAYATAQSGLDSGPSNVVLFKARKRATPVVTRSNESTVAAAGSCGITRFLFDSIVDVDRYQVNSYCAGSGGQNMRASFNWAADAEL